ncbi:MAG: SUMF1/EgtB/PvdO family nonheme iron enzyme, partial [Bacteroidota bacterium]
NNHDHLNPALNSFYFASTQAEYWWTSEHEADDATKIWVVNAGGGIGAHPKTETISAGGTKRFHVRAVRSLIPESFPSTRYTDLGNETVTDHLTGLMWQKVNSSNTMTWEEALAFASGFSLAGKTDWRLPNIKELQSLNDVNRLKPSIDNSVFTGINAGNFWSSTTMINSQNKAWDMNVDFGIVSYNEKNLRENVLLVRGGLDNPSLNISESNIPGGDYMMGDHFGFVDPHHPSDELPLHLVKVDSFNMAKTATTNLQFLAFLNAALLDGSVTVTNNIVYKTGTSVIVCYTYQYQPWYSIIYGNNQFSMADFRGTHPMVGVMWEGAALFCNWLSEQNNLEPCYITGNWHCDFTKNGYRLPTEAEWEWAGRGGHIDPYFNYPNGNSIITNQANLPNSEDPYETGNYPLTTPAGFYDGTLKQKSDYNWPGSATTYQTADGVNGFGLYDMQGNVWELVNDWYSQNYYSSSPYDNPKGPDTGFIMPDGKPYRGMRGGNWYNGYDTNGVNDGHSRVSNRNPSYYRGPQDPNHPWYHVGFRVARKYSVSLGLGDETKDRSNDHLNMTNYPNPVSTSTIIKYHLPESGSVLLFITDIYGRRVSTLLNEMKQPGDYSCRFEISGLADGLYFYTLTAGGYSQTKRLVVLRK